MRALQMVLMIAWTSAAVASVPTDDPVLSEAMPSQIDGAPPGPPPPADQVDRIAHEIGLGIRCPVCQGLSVADSTSAAAVLIQKRVREMVAAGYTKSDIEAYFASKYGEWVLLAPTTEGLNRVVWVGPGIAFALGLLAAATFLGRGTRRVEAPAPPPPPSDPYAAKLLAEVDDD